MRRILLGFIISALIFGVAFAGAKVATVTNPMSTNLDGGGFQITNAEAFITPEGGMLNGGFVQAHSFNLSTGNTNAVTGQQLALFAGTDDPTTGVYGNQPPGSFYLRRVDDAHGQEWFKFGGNLTDWACLAGCGP